MKCSKTNRINVKRIFINLNKLLYKLIVDIDISNLNNKFKN